MSEFIIFRYFQKFNVTKMQCLKQFSTTIRFLFLSQDTKLYIQCQLLIDSKDNTEVTAISNTMWTQRRLMIDQMNFHGNLTYHNFNFFVFFGNLTMAQKPRIFFTTSISTIGLSTVPA
ncbi:uncharacterized protein LOC122573296 [Bombus pyrosoma]|uniref:uncharacterized protein LOC122573296 n=1 Tax=Bombus pyrosoma TaxID=396416 RepID=UPI001CB925AE|nr:uncharacterized protein LOC122573296 [Bombus pyrosoma]